MNEQTIELMRELAAKLGTTSEYLWTVMVQAWRVRAVMDGVVALFFMALTVICVRVYRGCSDQYHDDIKVALSFIIGAVSAIIALVSTYIFAVNITMPEYGALKELLGLIGGAR